jgi:hypothetical protein
MEQQPQYLYTIRGTNSLSFVLVFVYGLAVRFERVVGAPPKWFVAIKTLAAKLPNTGIGEFINTPLFFATVPP